MFEESSEFY
jgi:hypothetical protein